MKTIINPRAKRGDVVSFTCSPNAGLISTLSFENPVFWTKLEEMFDCKGDEYLIGIQVTEHGLQANIGHKKF